VGKQKICQPRNDSWFKTISSVYQTLFSLPAKKANPSGPVELCPALAPLAVQLAEFGRWNTALVSTCWDIGLRCVQGV
jgi:hypothetical protein